MPKTIVEDNIDILVAGAGLGGTGAAFEARYWGKNKKIVIAEKANIDRSGAVAQGLYAINCYMGTRFGENNPEDHVRYARIDLMGMVREGTPVRRMGLADHARSQVRLLFTRGTLADHDSR
jgi:adenylylsulfate reductase subunit A